MYMYIVCLIEGGSESETENGTPAAKSMKVEETHEAQSNRIGNEETEIKLESDSPCTFAYSVTFKEEHGQVKEEITEEQGWIYPQTTEGEDQLTKEGEDLNVVEMKYEEEDDNNLQVTAQVLICHVTEFLKTLSVVSDISGFLSVQMMKCTVNFYQSGEILTSQILRTGKFGKHCVILLYTVVCMEAHNFTNIFPSP
jgi:hypothetical protein